MSAPAFYRRAVPASARESEWQGRDGWTLRRFDWPPPDGRPARGSLLFQGGRGDVVEKYLETLAHFHARGWAVTSFDWRGQGGSGRLGRDRLVGHLDSFTDLVADLELFWRAWMAAGPGPHVVVAHSMGAFLLLRALAERAVAPAAAVLVAPMLGLRSPIGARAGQWLARAMARLGDPTRAAWKANTDPAAVAGLRALLTHDAGRYADQLWWYEARPELRLGPPSWGWLVQAFAGTAALRADPRLAEIATPVLMLVADHDRLVDPRAALAVAARLPDAEVRHFGPEAAHEILREVDAVRDRALAAIDDFLDARVPRP
jgi:lysophospholipase